MVALAAGRVRLVLLVPITWTLCAGEAGATFVETSVAAERTSLWATRSMRRSRLKGHHRARTWTTWAILAYDFDASPSEPPDGISRVSTTRPPTIRNAQRPCFPPEARPFSLHPEYPGAISYLRCSGLGL
jgi:hypothetical protein